MLILSNTSLLAAIAGLLPEMLRYQGVLGPQVSPSCPASTISQSSFSPGGLGSPRYKKSIGISRSKETKRLLMLMVDTLTKLVQAASITSRTAASAALRLYSVP